RVVVTFLLKISNSSIYNFFEISIFERRFNLFNELPIDSNFCFAFLRCVDIRFRLLKRVVSKSTIDVVKTRSVFLKHDLVSLELNLKLYKLFFELSSISIKGFGVE